jgi:hypothetical protein
MKSRIAILCLAITGLSSCISTEYEPPVKLRDDNLDNLRPLAYVQSTCTQSVVLTHLSL